MATTNPRNQESTAVRERHIILGRDQQGHIHHYHTPTERVHVVDPETGRIHGRDVAGVVDEWVAEVADTFGWDTRLYGVGVVGLLERSLEDG